MAKTVQKNRLNLNLLYPQGLPQKLPFKLLGWVLTSGRYIAIIVEILVLVTFAARFKFDKDLSDINEEINRQVPFIESLNSQEALIRKTQIQIEQINKMIEKSPKWNSLMDKISKQTPSGVSLTGVNFDHPSQDEPVKIRITGESNSNSDLAVFLFGLSSDSSFKEVNLVNINFSEDAIDFTITALTKGT